MASVTSSNSSNFGDGLTTDLGFANVQVNTVADYIYVAYLFRCNDSADIETPPTWNSESFTLLIDVFINDSGTVRFKLYRLKVASTGTFNIVATLNVFKVAAGGYIVFTGVDGTSPNGTISQQSVWTWGAAPSLDVTDAVSGNLLFEILAPIGWDDGFNDLSATTWTAGSSQTQHFYQDSSNAPWCQMIFATKPGASGTQTLEYSPSAGQPGYAHVAMAIKHSGGSSMAWITA